jgi:hypothetical protein
MFRSRNEAQWDRVLNHEGEKRGDRELLYETRAQVLRGGVQR